MNEAVADPGLSYKNLIQEVFIDPIRTVIVVDDEFPTLSSLLARELSDGNEKLEKGIATKVQQIINFCHEANRRWMVEIHDGQSPTSFVDETISASNHHQSDLMILDFHLDRRHPDRGDDAIQILRNLAEGGHFNLVIVYTKGYEAAAGDIERVAREIAIGLSSVDNRLIMNDRSLGVAKETLEEWENFDDSIATKIIDEVDDGIYLKIRNSSVGDLNWNDVCRFEELQQLVSLLDTSPESVKKVCKPKALIKWAMHAYQQEITSRLSPKEIGRVTTGFDRDQNVNWIRTDRLFVTVVSKSNEASTLPEKLLSALSLWNPEPHRLLMSKMRAVLEKQGVIAENEVLSNRHLQAGWLQEYLTPDQGQRTWKILNTISRHWEGLGDALRQEVAEFAERLAILLLKENRANVVAKWHSAVQQDNIHSHLNRYACSKRVEGGHLTTGHVLRVQIDQAYSYWLCLSPACDLVPGQKSSGWPKRLGGHMALLLVELFVSSRERALSNAYGGNHLFLEIDNEVKLFSFTPDAGKSASDGSARVSNPKWEQMFAADQGRFTFDNSKIKLKIRRTAEQNGQLELSEHDAEVVAQLRYEYALNLLQRLGANLSRVGLDFVELEKSSTNDGQDK
ncbi:MAG: hypothetical protein HYZ18_08165 [Pseudogulbenkiania sp.]|nr:hypothetical protein [Pseudogulbenkiania sp.]